MRAEQFGVQHLSVDIQFGVAFLGEPYGIARIQVEAAQQFVVVDQRTDVYAFAVDVARKHIVARGLFRSGDIGIDATYTAIHIDF